LNSLPSAEVHEIVGGYRRRRRGSEVNRAQQPASFWRILVANRKEKKGKIRSYP